MHISKVSLPVLLCMNLFVSIAIAEDIGMPDKEHRQGMSYEEYSQYREKMRMHIKQMEAEESAKKAIPADKPDNQADKLQPKSAYGQGYHSRSQMENKADGDASNRPERPRMERFNRGNMGRR